MYADPVKILITGAAGQVGSTLANAASADSFFEVIALSKEQLDITDEDAVRACLDKHMPHYVVNCAEYNRVDSAEKEAEQSYAINSRGVELLALACGELAVPMLHLSTDYVFDGHYASGYTEDDEAAPLGVYGKSKWQGEELLRQFLPRHIIIRTSWVFSPAGDNYVLRTLDQCRRQDNMLAVDDRRGCPTSAADIARVLMAVLKQLESGAEAWGTYHYTGAEITSLYGFTREIMAMAGEYESLRCQNLTPVAAEDFPYEAQRPISSVLVCRKLLNTFGIRQRPWRNELSAVMRSIYQPETSGSEPG